MVEFITRHGKALDLLGAFLFVIGFVASLANCLLLFALCFFCGAMAFVFSFAVWQAVQLRSDEEKFYRICCILLSIISAILFVAAVVGMLL